MLAAREINAAGGIDVGGTRHRLDLAMTDIREGTDMATSSAQSLLTCPDIAADAGLMSALPAPRGLCTTHHWHLAGAASGNRAFVAAFTRVFGHARSATAASTYDAVRLVADAMHRAGSASPATLRDAIAGTRDFRGATGTLDSTGRQDPARRAVTMRLQHGRLEVVREGTS